MSVISTLSGRRLRRDERRVEGGGYVDLTPSVPSESRGSLIPAHGVVLVRAAGTKKGEVEVPHHE